MITDVTGLRESLKKTSAAITGGYSGDRYIPEDEVLRLINQYNDSRNDYLDVKAKLAYYRHMRTKIRDLPDEGAPLLGYAWVREDKAYKNAEMLSEREVKEAVTKKLAELREKIANSDAVEIGTVGDRFPRGPYLLRKAVLDAIDNLRHDKKLTAEELAHKVHAEWCAAAD